MNTQAILNSYLSELDKALNQLPVSDRADIIVEIKSHVLEAQAKNPNQSLDEILSSIGEPNAVAKRYLQERGVSSMQPAPRASGSMMWLANSIKWLVIGFISFVALLLLVIALIIWRFTPLISVDDTHNKVSIGGGIINVTGEKPVQPALPVPANNIP